MPVTICQAAMYAHNKLRVHHAADALTYNDELAELAEAWAMDVSYAVHDFQFGLTPNPSGTLSMATVEFNWNQASLLYTLADVVSAW